MNWIRDHITSAVTVALAAGLVAYSVISTAGDHLAAHPWAELFAAMMAGSVLLRTRAPLGMALVASAGAVGFGLLPNPTTPLWAFLAILVVSFSVGTNLGGARRWIALAVLLVGGYVLQVASVGRADPSDSTFVALFLAPLAIIGCPCLAGGLLRHSRQQTARLHQLSDELTAERERHAEAAVTIERARLARELHDVISHAVTEMVVQAGAAEQLATDPALRQQIHGIRQSGKQAIDELRRQLGLMRAGRPVSPSALPGLAQLGDLAASCGAYLSMDGVGALELSPGLELAVYRVVQEALTNAHRHAPGAAVSVRLQRLGHELDILILDDGPGASVEVGAASGLSGMRERVGLYGGSVTAGPREASPGWQVHVRLPCGLPAAARVAP